jgi:CheY-like chemotaxis protein/anti-sigma regulatory factor (Ser/Thr protein kinase)
MEDLDLSALLAQAVETSRSVIEQRGHELQVRYPASTLRVHGDRARLAQVLTNLLDNAAKFTPEGGHVIVSAERRGERAAVRVRDDGIGIRAEQLQGIFDLFAQADASPERPVGGLGIGLSLVRGLVEIHGGTVEAASEGPGRGAEFTVQLPLSAAVGELPANDAPEIATAPERRSGRVVLVDDNLDTRESLAQLVELWGYQVRTAPDAPAALELCRSFLPNVVLIDIGLPGMNGYDLARILRATPGLERASLIALTGYAQDGHRRLSENAGIDHYTVKPADPAALAALLASCLAR